MLNIYKPSQLRGNLERSNYFEGWFQKIVSKDHRAAFVIIYGYATNNSADRTGFIQLHIPEQAPQILHFSKEEISLEPQEHTVRMGSNVLSTRNIQIQTNDLSIQLDLINNNIDERYKNSMGYNYFIPNLPCYHSVLNRSHMISGSIRNGSREFLLNEDIGYMEKNWGTSFPDKYVWMHAIDPHNPTVQILFSQAEIKWMGKTFVKHVGYVHFQERHIDLRTLRNCKIFITHLSAGQQLVQINSRSLQLEIAISTGKEVLLKGPQNGVLSRDIAHYAAASMDVQLSLRNEKHLFQLIGNYENIGNFTSQS